MVYYNAGKNPYMENKMNQSLLKEMSQMCREKTVYDMRTVEYLRSKYV